jgi:hypothetical protein
MARVGDEELHRPIAEVVGVGVGAAELIGE